MFDSTIPNICVCICTSIYIYIYIYIYSLVVRTPSTGFSMQIMCFWLQVHVLAGLRENDSHIRSVTLIPPCLSYCPMCYTSKTSTVSMSLHGWEKTSTYAYLLSSRPAYCIAPCVVRQKHRPYPCHRLRDIKHIRIAVTILPCFSYCPMRYAAKTSMSLQGWEKISTYALLLSSLPAHRFVPCVLAVFLA